MDFADSDISEDTDPEEIKPCDDAKLNDEFSQFMNASIHPPNELR